jgi:hypothetical protein
MNPLPAPPASVSRRTALVSTLSSLFSLAACGGGGGGDEPYLPPVPPPPPIVPVDGPAWFGFGRNPQHTALLSEIPAQALTTVWWHTPVDLAPSYSSGGSLLLHYGSPVITRQNTVIVPVKTGSNSFRVEGRIGATGGLLWTLDSDYRLPPHNWVPSYNPALTSDGRVAMPMAGGRVRFRATPNAGSGAEQTVAFYGDAAYAAAPATYDGTVFINTPLTTDTQGNTFFGFTVTGSNPAAVVGGIARIGADGSVRWIAAADAAGDPAMTKTATNSAPALSPDGSRLYVLVNYVPTGGGRAGGRLLALDSTTLAPIASSALIDPLFGGAAWVNDNASSSPTVGPDGRVYIGVLEANAPAHNFRGWLLQFDAGLAPAGVPGGFGWDNCASIVPRAMLPQYAGASNYLLALKYNSYGGVGTGDGQHRVAIVDPNDSQVDRFSSTMVMREVITVLSPTDDENYGGGRTEWCINTAAVDPATSSVLMNNEDGYLYRWHLPTNTLQQRIRMNNGYAQSYTPTAVGADGRVYAVNNARLFSVGA